MGMQPRTRLGGARAPQKVSWAHALKRKVSFPHVARHTWDVRTSDPSFRGGGRKIVWGGPIKKQLTNVKKITHWIITNCEIFLPILFPQLINSAISWCCRCLRQEKPYFMPDIYKSPQVAVKLFGWPKILAWCSQFWHLLLRIHLSNNSIAWLSKGKKNKHNSHSLIFLDRASSLKLKILMPTNNFSEVLPSWVKRYNRCIYPSQQRLYYKCPDNFSFISIKKLASLKKREA